MENGSKRDGDSRWQTTSGDGKKQITPKEERLDALTPTPIRGEDGEGKRPMTAKEGGKDADTLVPTDTHRSCSTSKGKGGRRIWDSQWYSVQERQRGRQGCTSFAVRQTQTKHFDPPRQQRCREELFL